MLSCCQSVAFLPHPLINMSLYSTISFLFYKCSRAINRMSRWYLSISAPVLDGSWDMGRTGWAAASLHCHCSLLLTVINPLPQTQTAGGYTQTRAFLINVGDGKTSNYQDWKLFARVEYTNIESNLDARKTFYLTPPLLPLPTLVVPILRPRL